MPFAPHGRLLLATLELHTHLVHERLTTNREVKAQTRVWLWIRPSLQRQLVFWEGKHRSDRGEKGEKEIGCLHRWLSRVYIYIYVCSWCPVSWLVRCRRATDES